MRAPRVIGATIIMPATTNACLCLVFTIAVSAKATTYNVGPGHPYSEIDAVPWESLTAGDVVQIFWRATPYRSKWVIARAGTASDPIIVRGVASSGGARPIIDGNDARTRLALDYWNENRGVIKIGGASVPSGPGVHLIIESLEVRGAHPTYTFIDDHGASSRYISNAASIFIEHGEHIVIRDCILHDSGNGLFVANLSHDITIESSHIFGNGNIGSAFEHNTYTEALDMLYQFNHFGPLRPGALGNNLKDRSAALTVRYNWIEDGNRQLDLVDSAKFAITDPVPYGETFVYGNVLVEHDNEGNRQIVHYGGDSGNEAHYRQGTLYFFHNTIVSERLGRSTLFRLATNNATAEIYNNVFFNVGGASTLELGTTAGVYRFNHNWLRAGYVASFDSSFAGTISHLDSISGDDPGFQDRENQNYRPRSDSPLLGAGGSLPLPVQLNHSVDYEYEPHRNHRVRDDADSPALGAFAARAITSALLPIPAFGQHALLIFALTIVITTWVNIMARHSQHQRSEDQEK